MKLYLISRSALEYDDSRYHLGEGLEPEQIALSWQAALDVQRRLERKACRGVRLDDYYHWEGFSTEEFLEYFPTAQIPTDDLGPELIIPEDATDEQIDRFIDDHGGFYQITEVEIDTESIPDNSRIEFIRNVAQHLGVRVQL